MEVTKKQCEKCSIHHQCSVSKSNTFISADTFHLEVSKSMAKINNTTTSEVFSAQFDYVADFEEHQFQELLDYLIAQLGTHTSTNPKNYRWTYLDGADRMNDKISIELFPMQIKIHWENNKNSSNKKMLNKLNKLSNEISKLISK